MEYRVNKIDTDLRDRIKEQTKEGKIHSKQKGINIDKNKKGNKREEQSFDKDLKKHKNNKEKIKINAVKYEKKDIQIQATKEEKQQSIVGTMIDVKK